MQEPAGLCVGLARQQKRNSSRREMPLLHTHACLLPCDIQAWTASIKKEEVNQNNQFTLTLFHFY